MRNKQAAQMGFGITLFFLSVAATPALGMKGETRTPDMQPRKTVSTEKYDAEATASKKREEHLFFELGLGTLVKTSDRYVRRLNDFNFQSTEILDQTAWHWNLSMFVAVIRYLQLGLTVAGLDSGNFEERESARTFKWDAYALGLCARARLPLANDWVVLYIQSGGGLAWGRTFYKDNYPHDESGSVTPDDSQRFWRYHVSGGGGAQLMPWRFFGFFMHGEYIYAPVISNLIGDKHNSGGIAIVTGVRGGF